MTKDVLITISGLQFTENNDTPSPIEVITGGDYYFRNNTHFILFDELSEQSKEVTKNTIKIKPDKVEITKKGHTMMHMIFERGQKNHTYYETPFGSLLLAILADDIKIEEADNNIDVNIAYTLEANSEPVADCKIKIKITSKENGNFTFNIPS